MDSSSVECEWMDAKDHSYPSRMTTTRPVVDHRRCEAKRECVKVCPYDVFEVRRIDSADFAALGLLGKLRIRAHRLMTAYPVRADQCQACGKCVSACPEGAVTLLPIPEP
jgi:NAD-dependent dihydropyrimidine dehydrogenase PreA subunit